MSNVHSYLFDGYPWKAQCKKCTQQILRKKAVSCVASEVYTGYAHHCFPAPLPLPFSVNVHLWAQLRWLGNACYVGVHQRNLSNLNDRTGHHYQTVKLQKVYIVLCLSPLNTSNSADGVVSGMFKCVSVFSLWVEVSLMIRRSKLSLHSHILSHRW